MTTKCQLTEMIKTTPLTHQDRQPECTRRQIIGATAAIAAMGFAGRAHAQPLQASAAASASASAQATDAPPSLAAKRPDGFLPMAAPGLIVKASKSNTLQPNQLWPTDEAAKVLLERSMTELTGKSTIGEAFGRFVHPKDKVAIKLNGIGAQTGATMGTNKELVLEIVRGVLEAGVPPENLWIFEQFPSFLLGTRINDRVLPDGVKSYTHNNTDA
ncbi:MAG: hypothetical protein FWD57_02255, partial [Polyangiaceae bacterium]|nr:hypothetical protein [Polyangiaceae bacterium]